jgi:predicted transcriptional regulator
MPRETMTVRIEPETRKELDALAAAIDRDRSHVVNQALTAYLEMHRWQIDHIKQGLREAAAGKFVSDSGMKKIITRLRRK